ncbi:hypothetical protein DFQ26_009508, partial [Actinomortierella ambigua]
MDRASSGTSTAAGQPEDDLPHRPSLSLRPRPSGRPWNQPSTVSPASPPTAVTGQGYQQHQQPQRPRAISPSNSQQQHPLPSLPPTPPAKSPSHTPLELSSLESVSSAKDGDSNNYNNYNIHHNNNNSPHRSKSSIQLPPKTHHRHLLTRDHTLPAIPPLPPPHDSDFKDERDSLDDDIDDFGTRKPLPPPKTGAHAPPTRQKTFLVGFMGRHPWIRQHRRRFIALVFVGIFFLITLIVLLAVLLPSKDNDDDDYGVPDWDGGGGGGGVGGDYDDDIYHTGLKDKKKLADLKKFNDDKTPPPVNTAVSSGWTDRGSGQATYY